MNYEVITTIVVDTKKYAYTMSPNGTGGKNIDPEYEECKLEFRFNSDALANIVLRDKPVALKVDNLHMIFDYRGYKLVAIHFEDEGYIYMVSDFRSFLDICRKEYVLTEFMKLQADKIGPRIMDISKAKSMRMVQTDVLDEFEDMNE